MGYGGVILASKNECVGGSINNVPLPEGMQCAMM